ncbi:aldo/keto reductase, partial [Nonomuraea fuscirosea]
RYARPGAAASRVSPESISERDRAAVRVVTEVAGELGVTPSQVAIAWAVARGVHPIIGASTEEQLTDNLGASDVRLPEEAVRRLEAAAEFELGFPGDFIAQTDASQDLYGDALPRLIGR